MKLLPKTVGGNKTSATMMMVQPIGKNIKPSFVIGGFYHISNGMGPPSAVVRKGGVAVACRYRFLAFWAEEGDKAHGEGGLRLHGVGVAFLEEGLIGPVAAVLGAQQQAGSPLVLIGCGELIQRLR